VWYLFLLDACAPLKKELCADGECKQTDTHKTIQLQELQWKSACATKFQSLQHSFSEWLLVKAGEYSNKAHVFEAEVLFIQTHC
jgi:hypothetical protein